LGIRKAHLSGHNVFKVVDLFKAEIIAVRNGGGAFIGYFGM